MRHTSPHIASLASTMFARQSYFIVEHKTVNPGSGESHTLYLSMPGEWSELEADAMRFPQRVLAEAHANRFRGTVKECKSPEQELP